MLKGKTTEPGTSDKDVLQTKASILSKVLASQNWPTFTLTAQQVEKPEALPTPKHIGKNVTKVEDKTSTAAGKC